VTKQKLKRIERLVSLKERRRDVLQGVLAGAERTTRAHWEVLSAAEDRWLREIARAVATGGAQVHEMLAERMHLETLRERADLAHHEHRRALENQERCAADVRHAERELRQMERWSETVNDALRSAQERRERIDTDELAARITQRGDDERYQGG
jgi:hypothetical protein